MNLNKPSMSRNFSVQLHQPLMLGGAFMRSITKHVENYSHQHKLMGGMWSAGWDMIEMSPSDMRDFFMRRISCRVKQKTGSLVAWGGFIWEMDFFEKGVLRRMSMENVRNSIKCMYTDIDDNNTKKSTSWYQKAESIARYGEIQEIVYLNKTTTATAEAFAQTMLSENSYPHPEIISVKKPEPQDIPTLSVSCVGYVYTINYKYVDLTDAKANISTHIANMVDQDLDSIYKGSIQTNTVQVAPPDSEVRCWDWLKDIAEIGDGTSPYMIEVTGRRLSYYELSPNPVMYWDGKNITTATSKHTSITSWNTKPGVLRDLTWPETALPSAMFLSKQADTIVQEVDISENNEMPILKTDRFDESDYLAELIKNTGEDY